MLNHANGNFLNQLGVFIFPLLAYVHIFKQLSDKI